MTRLTVAAVLALALGAYAGDFADGAARPRPITGPSAGQDKDVRVARSSSGWLTVWQDDRRSRDGVLHSVAGRRVSADGKLLDAEPLVIAPEVTHTFPAPTVAGCGDGWLVTWMAAGGVYVAAVAADGSVREVASKLGPSGLDPYPEVACVGEIALVVWQNLGGNWKPMAVRVDVRSGKVLGDVRVLASADGDNLMRPRVAADGKRFLVVWEELSDQNRKHRIWGRRVGVDGQVLDEKPLLFSGDGFMEQNPRVAGGAGSFLVTWLHQAGGLELWAQAVPGEGRLAKPPVLVEKDGARAMVGWDGELFHVVWRKGVVVTSARLRPGTAALVGHPSVVVAEPPGALAEVKKTGTWSDGDVDVAGGAGRALYVWESPARFVSSGTGYRYWADPEDLVDVVGALTQGGGKLGRVMPLASGPAAQHSPAAAGFDGQWLVAWVELRDVEWRVYASRFDGQSFLDGAGFVLSREAKQVQGPAVAAGPDGYLVVWQEPGRIHGVRVDRRGRVLDKKPLMLSSTGGHAAAAAFDGKNYQVTWSESGRIVGVRVSPAGEKLDALVQLSEKVPSIGNSAVACRQGGCLVVWTIQGRDVHAAVVVDGAVGRRDPRRPRLVYSRGVHGWRPAVATTPDGYAVTWEEQPATGVTEPDRPMLVLVNAEGIPVEAPEDLSSPVGEGLRTSVVWHDGKAVVVWTAAKGGSRRVELSRSGSPHVLGEGSEAVLAGAGPGVPPIVVWRAGGRIHARALP